MGPECQLEINSMQNNTDVNGLQQTFVDYLIGLAAEGETMLFVRQKPVLADGQIQTHANGAVKAVWPAFLPEN